MDNQHSALPAGRLTGEEVQDPYRVLDQLFDFAHLHQVKEYLWEWFTATITGSYVRQQTRSRSRDTIVLMYQYMEKLVEAAHLLHNQHHQNVSKSTVNPADVGRHFLVPAHGPLRLRCESLAHMAHIIREELQPAMIFHLGSVEHWPSFLQDSPHENEEKAQEPHLPQEQTAKEPAPFSEYFLALMPPHAGRSMQEYECTMENHRGLSGHFVMVKALTEVNRLRKKGHPFFLQHCIPSAELYHDGQSFLDEAPEPDRKEVLEKVLALSESWLKMSEGFLLGAKTYLQQGLGNHTAFMLHQAAEHAFTCILVAATGYREGTHNLHKLLRLCRLYAPAVADVFKPSSANDEHLFRQLQKAYTCARYKDDFHIEEKGLQTLYEKLGRLLQRVREGREQFQSGLQ
jgi:HEPN domain-containing protein